ncbi:uncharacterized protein C17orf113-like [Saccostrea cucullata]|uniref:uncharacterized protein C17orf113-like n=1 Tax=Saccostrea cuccullata TaxID=36930 RepID=UPI002ECFF8F1
MPAKKIKGPTDPKQPRLSFLSMTTTTPESSTSSDVSKVTETDVTEQPERHFQGKWLALHPWLEYDSDSNKMFCRECKKYGMNNIFTSGTNNYRTSTLARHVASKDHQTAILAPEEQGHLKKSIEKAHNKQEKAVIVAMKAVYWLAKEGIALSKYSSFIRFLKDLGVPDIDALDVNKHVDYTSYNTANDLLKSMSNVIDQEITDKLQKSPTVTIMTDESTDIANHHKLCISARVVDPISLQPSTFFLSDVRITNGTGKGIFNAIKEHLDSRGVAVKKVMGLGTDGASTMTGTKEGLTGHFLRENPHMKNNHCAAHRLALCSEQAAKGVPGMVKFQQSLETLFYHFKKSPTKADKLEAIQNLLNEPSVKYREVHQVRWLSFYEALDSVYRTLDSLLSYCSSDTKDPKVVGLRKKVGSEIFISLTYAMMDILQPIMKLSLVFQKKDLDLGVVQEQ